MKPHTHQHMIRRSVFVLTASCFFTMQALAAMRTDANGNVGYDSLAECEAAIASPSVKFYQPFTQHPPLKRAGEADVKQMRLQDLTNANYSKGSCDIGVGRSQNGAFAQRQGCGSMTDSHF
jgi:hypothetical protein